MQAPVQANAAELRVLGCLIEKQRTTPETYPLSLNSLRLACNQSTNRDPVVEYDDATIRQALERLNLKGWVRPASGPGSRTAKFRHLFDEAMHVSDEEISILAVLMLRGPQTPGELRARVDRLYSFSDGELERTLDGLIEREFVARHPRRPGQKEERYGHRLSEELEDEAAMPTVAASLDAGPPAESRLDRIERELAELKSQVAELLRRE